MRKSLSLLVAVPVAAAMAGFGGTAFARHSNPGGLFNVTVGGYELVSNGSSQSRIALKGVGTIDSDPSGALSGGTMTISAVDPEIPEASPAETLCTGTATGNVTSSGNQMYTITFDYTDSANSGQCLSQTLAMDCTRHVFPPGLRSDLAAGTYQCVVTGVTNATGITGAALRAHFGAQNNDTVTP